MPPNPTRLLVLEDDPVIARIIATLAGEVGMQARIAADGADFFDILTHWMPTHLSVDLMMPGIDGVQILARLSQLACEARILIVSGVDSRVLASAMRMAREHELPVLGSLGKPFVHAELKALLAMPLATSHPADAALRLPDIGADSRGAALDRGEFVLHYQPKVDLPARAVSGFEALARWHHPRHGILSPDWFIPSLEEDGSIVRLTGQVLEQAVGWAGRAVGMRGSPPSVAINLSARDIADPGLASRLSELTIQHRVDPASIVLEITETNAMRDPRTALATVTRLRLLGFRVALDDFGTGYSSLAHLARLPLSSLKIDKSFVQGMANSSEARKIVEAIIRLGSSLGLELVAEGVENEETAIQLGDMGCHQIQGFLISAALPEAAIPGWLDHWSGRGGAAEDAQVSRVLTNV